MMNDPIRVTREDAEPLLTAQEIIALDKARNDRRIQWVFMGLIGFVVVGFLTPVFVWLTRLALGG
jgi:hypothetical protein